MRLLPQRSMLGVHSIDDDADVVGGILVGHATEQDGAGYGRVDAPHLTDSTKYTPS